MISEELLSEVLGWKVINIEEHLWGNFDPCIKIEYTTKTIDGSLLLNIYELAHKCKEWARTQDYYIQTGNRLDGTTRYDVLSARIDIDFEDYDDGEIFSEVYDTEPSAIFKACEWIKANT